ncbi:MAG TPA: hypothetical protein VG733_04140 [Chthoniobacteraceae bacterium]|nr:hypothetical protein [Verrucomicrobiae bacterium]HWB58653.1 hypothetical protein [Chthoniobacteraceae bacterium]
MDAPPRKSAPTYTEIFVTLVLVVVVGVLLGVYKTWIPWKINNVKVLGNARQIALALQLYAQDHGGKFPSYTLQNGTPTTTPVADSNTAFAQLFPTYVDQEALFWVPQSAFCSPNPPDEIIDKPPLDSPVQTLKSGENEWAYVLGLGTSSGPEFPLLADGFADPVAHTYTSDRSKKGGVWNGRKALLIHADGSANVLDVNQSTMTITGSNGGPAPGDIFTTANSANGWLGPDNTVVNPK